LTKQSWQHQGRRKRTRHEQVLGKIERKGAALKPMKATLEKLEDWKSECHQVSELKM